MDSFNILRARMVRIYCLEWLICEFILFHFQDCGATTDKDRVKLACPLRSVMMGKESLSVLQEVGTGKVKRSRTIWKK